MNLGQSGSNSSGIGGGVAKGLGSNADGSLSGGEFAMMSQGLAGGFQEMIEYICMSAFEDAYAEAESKCVNEGQEALVGMIDGPLLEWTMQMAEREPPDLEQCFDMLYDACGPSLIGIDIISHQAALQIASIWPLLENLFALADLAEALT